MAELAGAHPDLCSLGHSWTSLPASPAAGYVGHVTRFWPIECERSDERQAEVVKRGGWVFSPVPCPLEDDSYDLKGEVAQDKKRLGP